MTGLTRKQQQILDFILKWQRTQGTTPTYQEIADQFGFRSLNSVTEHVRLLRRKGFLESEPGKARALRVISPLANLRSRIVDIPLFGSIPAGLPQAREQDAEGCVSVDVESIGFKPTRNTFALRVTGDSMIGRHILDGDVVVLEHGPDPRNGQIVAALIDGDSTLKTFRDERRQALPESREPEISRPHPGAGIDDSGRVQGAHPKGEGMKRLFKIISGGQTGADRAALEWAMANARAPRRLVSGGPKGGGMAASRPQFNLVEMRSRSYALRTRRNVHSSDGTVIFSLHERLMGGSSSTAEMARKFRKPLLHLVASRGVVECAQQLDAFIKGNGITGLNVAGPRASEEDGVGEFVHAVLSCAKTFQP